MGVLRPASGALPVEGMVPPRTFSSHAQLLSAEEKRAGGGVHIGLGCVRWLGKQGSRSLLGIARMLLKRLIPGPKKYEDESERKLKHLRTSWCKVFNFKKQPVCLGK